MQVSADSRTLLDLKRRRSWDKLTGMQADYFGAFYKSSWRASDWMWGRVDGAGWLVQCLLDPQRLETLRDLVGPETFRDELVAALTPLWRAPDREDNGEPAELQQLTRPARRRTGVPRAGLGARSRSGSGPTGRSACR